MSYKLRQKVLPLEMRIKQKGSTSGNEVETKRSYLHKWSWDKYPIYWAEVDTKRNLSSGWPEVETERVFLYNEPTDKPTCICEVKTESLHIKMKLRQKEPTY